MHSMWTFCINLFSQILDVLHEPTLRSLMYKHFHEERQQTKGEQRYQWAPTTPASWVYHGERVHKKVASKNWSQRSFIS